MISVAVIFFDGLFEFIAQYPKTVSQKVMPITEFFPEGSVAPFDDTIVGGFAKRQAPSGISMSWQVASNSVLNSEPYTSVIQAT